MASLVEINYLMRNPMYLRSFFSLASLALMSAISTCAYAHKYTLGELHIGHPHTQITAEGQTTGAAFLSIENKGTIADTLISASSPAAETTDIRTMRMEDGTLKAGDVIQLAIPEGTRVTLQPNDAYRIVLNNLKKPFTVGEKFPLTLTFEKAGTVTVSVLAQDKSAKK